MEKVIVLIVLAMLYAGTIYLMWLRNYYRLPKEIRQKYKRKKRKE